MKDDLLKADFLDNLIDNLVENVKDDDNKTFEDIVNLDGSLNRELYLADIVSGTGMSIEGYIRFWNRYDEVNNIPVEEREPIKIYIDSPGGNLTDTYTMIDAIRMSTTPVWTICAGVAYSGGFFTFIAGDHRIAYPHASFLYHEGAVGQSSDAGKFRNFADFYQKQLDQMKDIVLEFTEIDDATYEEHRRDDWWMTAEEAMELGVVDEIAEGFVI